MSRCFPYPPPGYTRSNQRYDAQLIKLGEEKEKEEKKEIEEKEKEKRRREEIERMKRRKPKQSQGDSSVNGRAVTSDSSCSSSSSSTANTKSRKRNLMELDYNNLHHKLKLHDNGDLDLLYQHQLALTPDNKRRTLPTHNSIKTEDTQQTLQTHTLKMMENN